MLNFGFGSRTTVLNLGLGSPTTLLNFWFGSRTTALNFWLGSRTTEFNSGFGSRTTVLNFGLGSRTIAVTSWRSESSNINWVVLDDGWTGPPYKVSSPETKINPKISKPSFLKN